MKWLIALLVAAATNLTAPALLAETHVASWNIRHLGWGEEKNFDHLAEIAGAFDFLAVQEVMSEDGLAGLVESLERRTGFDWDAMASRAVGRGSYREFNAFVWRTDKVRWLDGATVYVDDRDRFEREPFSARFRSADGFDFTAATAHLIYGESVTEREKEAQALADYRDWLLESFPGTPLLVMGDFNLPPDNRAWAPMHDGMMPLITEGATTLSPKNGRFASLYDNIWAEDDTALRITGSGILDYPARLGLGHEAARETVSDHAPVWISIGATDEAAALPPIAATGPVRFSDEPGMPAILGNRNSGIFHLPHCAGYAKTGSANRVPFASEAEAVAAGYRRAKNC